MAVNHKILIVLINNGNERKLNNRISTEPRLCQSGMRNLSESPICSDLKSHLFRVTRFLRSDQGE